MKKGKIILFIIIFFILIGVRQMNKNHNYFRNEIPPDFITGTVIKSEKTSLVIKVVSNADRKDINNGDELYINFDEGAIASDGNPSDESEINIFLKSININDTVEVLIIKDYKIKNGTIQLNTLSNVRRIK